MLELEAGKTNSTKRRGAITTIRLLKTPPTTDQTIKALQTTEQVPQILPTSRVIKVLQMTRQVLKVLQMTSMLIKVRNSLRNPLYAGVDSHGQTGRLYLVLDGLPVSRRSSRCPTAATCNRESQRSCYLNDSYLWRWALLASSAG
jgi:hypothetical protein